MFDKNEILQDMSIEEKASLCSGGDYWHTKELKKYNIPRLTMSDGPHGLRLQLKQADNLGINESEKATCFPSGATICNSWDEDLIYKMGEALGEECLKNNVHILLGPGINIKRSPLCGRNFEYFSEDPYLTSKMGIAYVDGLQSTGVGACLKHFAANNQEERRRVINTIVDERTLREIYLYA
ncbi:MAG TPA: glycosyl hydrolase, partial [Clostridiales bacterium]|nr:glycosyl hydrolase [Clostridiales bacterium]